MTSTPTNLAAQSVTLEHLELFAGAGGLALGLHRAGFVPRLVADWDRAACNTLLANANHGRGYTEGWPVVQRDVRKLRYGRLPSVPLISAGAPCQPFSAGGLCRGETDERNLFGEVVRAVRHVRPRAFILENVRGLLFERCRPIDW